jgi:hypothetical protein
VTVVALQSGAEASMVAKITEAEGNDTNAMQILRDPPVITIKKSGVYAAFDLTYLWVKFDFWSCNLLHF